MSYRAFNVALLGSILGTLALVGVTNLVVDPFWYFRVVEIEGFNRDKPRAGDNARWIKPPLAVRLKPKAVIVGNSFAEIGLPPTHPGFTKQGSLPGYNLSVHGGTWDDIYCLARFAIDRLQVRRLVVTVHGIEGAQCPPDDEVARIDYGRALFSRVAIDASRQTLLQQDARPFGTAEGLWYFERYNERMQSEDEVVTQFARQLKAGLCDAPKPQSSPIDPAAIDRTPMAADKGMGLRKLIRSALANDVELVLLLNPTHVLFNEIFRQCGAGESHWQYRWWIASIVDQEARNGTRLVQFWDFFSYVPLTGERLHSGKLMRDRLWQDAGHFNNEVGAKVFDAIYGAAPDFGVEVTVANFDRVAVAVEAQRADFLARNPWVAQEIAEIFERARRLPPTPVR